MASEYEMREFTADELDALDISAGGQAVVMDEVTGHGRWDVIHTVVFALDGVFYQVDYSVPATESQEVETWGFPPILARVVRPVAVTSVQFVPVKKVERRG